MTSCQRWLLLAVLMLVGVPLTGCQRVAPYQRGRLAHPTMSEDYTSCRGREHVHAVHEGALGGSANPASGCGCN